MRRTAGKKSATTSSFAYLIKQEQTGNNSKKIKSKMESERMQVRDSRREGGREGGVETEAE